jgi:hypothetical protein
MTTVWEKGSVGRVTRASILVLGDLEGRVPMVAHSIPVPARDRSERPSPAAHRCQHGVNTDVMKALAQAFDR